MLIGQFFALPPKLYGIPTARWPLTYFNKVGQIVVVPRLGFSRNMFIDEMHLL